MSKSPKLLSISSYGDVDETISPRTWEDFGSSSDPRQGQFFLRRLGTDDSTIVILLFHYKDMFNADLTYIMHCNVCAPGCYLLRNRGPCKYPHIYSLGRSRPSLIRSKLVKNTRSLVFLSLWIINKNTTKGF